MALGGPEAVGGGLANQGRRPDTHEVSARVD